MNDVVILIDGEPWKQVWQMLASIACESAAVLDAMPEHQLREQMARAEEVAETCGTDVALRFCAGFFYSCYHASLIRRGLETDPGIKTEGGFSA